MRGALRALFTRVLLISALVLLGGVGCDRGEDCYWVPQSVVLQAEQEDGGISSAIRLIANAHGRTCGCCDGPKAITHYSWMLTADGIPNQSGNHLTEVEVPRPQGQPVIVSVTVTDSAGETASDRVTLVP